MPFSSCRSVNGHCRQFRLWTMKRSSFLSSERSRSVNGHCRHCDNDRDGFGRVRPVEPQREWSLPTLRLLHDGHESAQDRGRSVNGHYRHCDFLTFSIFTIETSKPQREWSLPTLRRRAAPRIAHHIADKMQPTRPRRRSRVDGQGRGFAAISGALGEGSELIENDHSVSAPRSGFVQLNGAADANPRHVSRERGKRSRAGWRA